MCCKRGQSKCRTLGPSGGSWSGSLGICATQHVSSYCCFLSWFFFFLVEVLFCFIVGIRNGESITCNLWDERKGLSGSPPLPKDSFSSSSRLFLCRPFVWWNHSFHVWSLEMLFRFLQRQKRICSWLERVPCTREIKWVRSLHQHSLFSSDRFISSKMSCGSLVQWWLSLICWWMFSWVRLTWSDLKRMEIQ